MVLLKWRDEFSLGIAEVDHEHRELMRSINAVHEALDQAQSAGEVSSVLGDIHAQIAAHFALEEKNMHVRAYPALAEHKRDHESLLDEIREIMDECEQELPYDRAAFAAKLNAWFETHFRTHDARLHKFLQPGRRHAH
jgi:hemerythrin-like metal-binding protein